MNSLTNLWVQTTKNRLTFELYNHTIKNKICMHKDSTYIDKIKITNE